MKLSHYSVFVIAALANFGVPGALPAAAAQPDVPYAARATGPDNPAMRMYYLGSVGHVGEFPGTLVRMDCEQRPTPAADRECAGGQRIALQTSDGTVYALVPGSYQAAQQLESATDLHKKVHVFGRLYTDSDAILAAEIRAEQGG